MAAAQPLRSAHGRAVRTAGTLLVVAGLAVLGWAFVTWQWGDPLTGLYTKHQQSQLADELDRRRAELVTEVRRSNEAPVVAAGAGERAAAAVARLRVPVPALARTYRRELGEGDPVGRLRVPSLGLNVVVVWGTGTSTLRRGPGVHRSTSLPGQGSLVYVAGHRTTYGAPFAHLDRLRPGDEAVVETPYGRFRYRVTGSEVVDDNDLSVLEPTAGEVLRLQACHPRFRASHRLVVTARLVSVTRSPL